MWKCGSVVCGEHTLTGSMWVIQIVTMSKSTNHLNRLNRSRAKFLPNTCQTDADMEAQDTENRLDNIKHISLSYMFII